MAAAANEVRDCQPSKERRQVPTTAQKELFVKALRLTCSILVRRKPSLLPKIQDDVDSLHADMTVKELLFVSRGLLTEIPLPRVWLMVRYPPVAAYAERLLEGADSLVSAKDLAEELLESADSRRDMAEVLLMLLTMSSIGDSLEYRGLERLLTDGVRPSVTRQIIRCCNNKCPESRNTSLDSKQPERPSSTLYDELLAAAESADWEVFFSCLKKGATVTGPPPQQTHDLETSEQTKTPGWDGPETQRSPLHAALGTGEFSLSALAQVVPFGEELANFTDSTGMPVLHVASLHDGENLDNVEFLLEHGADVNAVDSEGKTILQRLVDEVLDLREGARARKINDNDELNAVDRHVNTMMTLITHLAQHGQTVEWREGRDGWTVLHVLCAAGAHRHLVTCVRHGADPKQLRQGQTLIDTVVTQKCLPASRKVATLRVLLKDLNLAAFHSDMGGRRVANKKSGDFNMDTLPYMLSCQKEVNFEVLMMLFKNKAIRTEELFEVWREQGSPSGLGYFPFKRLR
ncbi:hypothetical protein ACOMHN_021510 [Nucella lapillus]